MNDVDKELATLEKGLAREYKVASDEAKKKSDKYFDEFKNEDENKRKAVAEGSMTQKEYDSWRQTTIFQGKRYAAMSESLANTYTNANKEAAKAINKSMPNAYAGGYNYAAYELEQGAKANLGFTLYDKNAVNRIVKDNPDLLPQARVDVPKDKKWNKKKINSAVTQGVLMGESMDEISDRLSGVADMNKAAAIRNARTMTISASNAGRLETFYQLRDMGIDIKKQWLSTLDKRTRHSHAVLDGETQDLDDAFSNGLQYPADPDGEPAEVYNCRCTIIASFDDVDLSKAPRNNRLGKMSYEEWKYGKQEQATAKHNIVNGKDLAGVWQRRPEEFEFGIEDVINAQGFDGLPRVVSEEEFNRLVEEANGGEGFVAQRNYSAPDQETLDEYRDMLYNGKWYVDCGTGGAQYGQGMYCAADYNGQLTDEIKAEMEHYQDIGRSRNIQKARIEYARSLTADDLNNSVYMSERAKMTDKEAEVFLKLKTDENLTIYKLPDDEKELMLKAQGEKKWLSWQGAYDEKIDKFKENYSGGFNYTETMTLDSSAKIISYKEANVQEKAYYFEQYANEDGLSESDIEKIKEIQGKRANLKGEYGSWSAERDRFKNENPELWEKVSEYETRYVLDTEDEKTMDVGEFAAMKGYDAINAEGHGKSGSYTVILNRTKLIIKEDK